MTNGQKPQIGDKRLRSCSECGSDMTYTHVPEQTAAFVGKDSPPPDPIPAYDAWACDNGACGREVRE